MRERVSLVLALHRSRSVVADTMTSFRAEAGRAGVEAETVWPVSPCPWRTPSAGIVGDEAALRRTLSSVSGLRGAGGRYTVLALQPESARLRAVWRWESGRG